MMNYRHILSLLLILIFNLNLSAQQTFSSPEQAVEWINNTIGKVELGGNEYQQKITLSKGKDYFASLMVSTLSARGQVSDIEYKFYFGHLDTRRVDARVAGRSIKIYLPTARNNRVIKLVGDGNDRGFQATMELFCDDIQVARDVAAAFEYIINNTQIGPPEFKNEAAALQWLQENIQSFSVGGDSYDQKFEVLTNERNKLVLTIIETDARNTTESKYEFYQADFNKNSGRMRITRNVFLIEFESTNSQPVVKFYQNDIQQRFARSFGLFTEDPKKAVELQAAFETFFGSSWAK